MYMYCMWVDWWKAVNTYKLINKTVFFKELCIEQVFLQAHSYCTCFWPTVPILIQRASENFCSSENQTYSSTPFLLSSLPVAYHFLVFPTVTHCGSGSLSWKPQCRWEQAVRSVFHASRPALSSMVSKKSITASWPSTLGMLLILAGLRWGCTFLGKCPNPNQAHRSEGHLLKARMQRDFTTKAEGTTLGSPGAETSAHSIKKGGKDDSGGRGGHKMKVASHCRGISTRKQQHQGKPCQNYQLQKN